MLSGSQRHCCSTGKRALRAATVLLFTLLLSTHVQHAGAPGTSEAAEALVATGDPGHAPLASGHQRPESIERDGDKSPTGRGTHYFFDCHTATTVFLTAK